MISLRFNRQWRPDCAKSGNLWSINYKLFIFMASGGALYQTLAKFGSYRESVYLIRRIASVRSSFSNVPGPAFLLHFCTFCLDGLRWVEQIPRYILSGLCLFQLCIRKDIYTDYCVSAHGYGICGPIRQVNKILRITQRIWATEIPFVFSSHCYNCCHVEAHLYFLCIHSFPLCWTETHQVLIWRPGGGCCLMSPKQCKR